MTLIPLLLILSSPLISSAKTICSRHQYTISNSNFYQKVETPSAVACVERCVENSDYCRAVVFTEQREPSSKRKRFCQLYGVNSESRNIRIRPEANYEPRTTLYEILDECPAGLSSNDEEDEDIMGKLSPELRSVIRNIPRKHADEHFGRHEVELTVNDEIQAPSGFERLTDFGVSGVSATSFNSRPQYPFSSSSPRKDSHSSSPDPQHAERDPIPISPVSVSHAGYGQSPARQFPCYSQNCRYQTQFSQSFPPQSYPTQPYPPPLPYPRPSYPCPAARRGDPCAPKPRCGPPPLPPCESYAAVEKITTELPKPYWSEWSPSGTCSVTCGSGFRQRKRFCSTGREADCEGEGSLEEPCDLPECNIWSDFGPWSQCSATCGGGEQQRSRYCKNGRNCVGPATERRSCADVDCPHWNTWSGWHECSASCGQGIAKRSRECLPLGSYDCPGEAQEHQSCELRPCPEWGPWLPWTECTKSCDGGERRRRRECLHGSNECPGPAEEHILCNQQSCPTWSDWGSWTQCSATCGDLGTRLRNRQCQYEGFPSNLCVGTAQDQSACQQEECPYFGEWTEWSSCSATCGHGQQTRKRRCEPRGYGCQGGDRELRFCQVAVCPYFDQWSEWGGCSVTCGRGTCERRRRCIQNDPLPGGILPSIDELEHIGRAEDATESNRKAALKDRLIERAQQIHNSRRQGLNDQRSRGRTNAAKDEEAESDRRLAPRRKTTTSHRSGNDDDDVEAIACVGPSVDRKECDAGPCCNWSSWAAFSSCNAVCGTGSKVRSRVCQVDVGFGGFSENPMSFQTDPMSPSFHSGIRPIRPEISMRGKRQAWGIPPRPPQTYVTPPTLPNMDARCDCVGPSVQTEVCTANECPPEPQIDPCSWSPWGEWCQCSGSSNCQQGIRARTRFCNQAEDGGRRSGRRAFCDCPGEKVQTEDCIPTSCSSRSSGRGSRPRGVLFSERDSMMPKEKTSEVGEGKVVLTKKTKDREERPEDFIIGDNFKEKTSLEVFEDEEDEVTSCRWSEWSKWSTCGADFLKQRTRFCVGLKALINNCECRGSTMQQTSCRPERDGHNFKPPSPAVLSVSRDILNEKLAKLDRGVKQHDDPNTGISDELPKTKIRAIPAAPKLLTGSDIITASDDTSCSFTEWSPWSPCDAPCGEEGERRRSRECPCNSCPGGFTSEIELCQTPKCTFNPNNSKKNPFD